MQEKVDDSSPFRDIFDVESSHQIPVYIIHQHSRSGVWSEYHLLLPVNVPVSSMKRDMEAMLNIPHDLQKWRYKQKELDDNESIENQSIRSNEFIHVTKKE